MARRSRTDEERSMDSLMDAMTNVVGVLLLILIVSSLGISAAVKKVVENLPEVTQEELEIIKSSRQKTLDNLQELQNTRQNTEENLPTKEEAAKLVAELEEFEKNNKDLADKTSDIEEWKKKVEEEEATKAEKEKVVLEADQKNRELAAILAQTPEREVKVAKEIKMPNPRVSDPESQALYLACKNERLYYIGDPYEHAFKIRDVIDQNFSDLAYTGKQVGQYTYALKGTKKDDNDRFMPLSEEVRLNRREKEALAAWDKIDFVWTSKEGEKQDDISLFARLFGDDDEGEFPVQKFKYDEKKLAAFFGDGKFGPKGLKYFVQKDGGDRVTFGIGFKDDGGWKEEEFMAQNSEFDKLCKQASANRRTVFFYYVAADSFDTYLQARSKSEFHGVPAGWVIIKQDVVTPQAIPQKSTIRYNLDTLPAEQYMQLANSVGPYLIEERNKEYEEFTDRVATAVPDDFKEEAKKNEFIAKLTTERREWNATRFQGYAISPYQAALAATEAKGEEEIQIEFHPPNIPHIRVFTPSRPPDKPTEPTPPGEKPKPDSPSSGPRLILD